MSDSEEPVKIPEFLELDSGPLYISIFLLVLCLFVVLTSISSVDKAKLEKLTASLTETFSKPVDAPITTKERAALDPSTEFTDLISSWAMSLYALEGVSVDRKRNMVLIGIPINIFFDAEGDKVRDAILPKLKEMVEMIRKELYVNRVSMEVFVTFPTTESEQDRDKYLSVTSSRVWNLTQSIKAMELPELLIRSGVQEDYDERVFLRFMITSQPTPKNQKPKTETKGNAP
jgi:hypothetical protein